MFTRRPTWGRILARVLLLSLLLPLSVFAGVAKKASPTAPPPSYGEYREEHEDLWVKVQGGYITITRSRAARQWQINPHWSALAFVHRNNMLYGLARNDFVYKQVDANTYVDELDPNKRITKTPGGYRWSNRLGDFIDYNEALNATAYGDRNNNTVTFSYDVDGRMTGITGPDAQQEIWFDYTLDGASNIITLVVRDGPIADPVTGNVTYTYNTSGQLITVTDPRGYHWRYTYTDTTDKAKIATRIDPEGRVTTLTHAGATLASITDASGRVTRSKYEYDKTRRQYYRQEKTPGGRITEIWFDDRGRILREDINGVTERSIVIDAAKSTETQTNAAGHKIVRRYDQWDNVTQVTHSTGAVRTTGYRAADNLITRQVNERGVETAYAYDASGNLTRITEALGTPVQRITDLTYDSHGNVLTVTRQADADSAAATITYTYDAKGNIASIRDAEAQLIFSAAIYNQAGQVLEWRDGRDLTWKQTFDAEGNPLSFINPLNETTRFAYDSFANLISQTEADSTLNQFEYDADGRPTAVIDGLLARTRIDYNPGGQIQRIVDAENKTVQAYTYDQRERPVQVTDGAGNINTYEYGGDAVAPNQLGAVITPLARIEYRYDHLARPQMIITHPGPDARISESVYDEVGNLIESTDPKGRVTRLGYDALNRLVESIDVTGGDKVKISYDNRDNPLTLTNENDVVIRTFGYDKNNQRVTETWAAGEVFTYAYDGNGNQIQKVDALGQVTRYSFDDAGRLASTRFYTDLVVTTPYKTVNYNFDSRGRFTGYDDGVTSSTISYDAVDRKLSETVHYGSFSKTFAYSYYKNGRKKTFTGPDPDGAGPLSGPVTTYQYDAGNRWLSTHLPGAGTITVNSHTWRVADKLTFPGGTTQTHQYDIFGQAQRITSRDPARNLLMDLTYSYDKAGNILSRSNPSGVTNYSYDHRDRLTGVDAPGTADDESYGYDPAGNRLSAHNTSGAWQYNDNNQLLAYGDKAFTYDANGNTLTQSDSSTLPATLLKSYVYNQEDRLTTIKDAAELVIAHYDYDPLGQRLKKTTGGSTTYYLYADEGLIAEFDASGNQTQAYGYVPGSQRGTNPLYTHTAAGYAYYHTDHLGTPLQMTTASGAKVWEATQDAFGNATVTLAGITNNLRLPGQYYDAESGQHDNHYRRYNPATGRYGTSDPIGLAGGLNTYAYAGQNPLKYMDPDGLIIQFLYANCVRGCLIGAGLFVGISAIYDWITGADCPAEVDFGNILTGCLFGCLNPLNWFDPYGKILGKLANKTKGWWKGRKARKAKKDEATKGLGKVDPNKLNHIFGQEKHKLGPLVGKFGGNQEKAFRALDDAAQKAFKSGKLNLKNGVNTQTRVNINGVNVDLVGGRVVNGRFQIGSASRRDIP